MMGVAPTVVASTAQLSPAGVWAIVAAVAVLLVIFYVLHSL